MPMPVFDQENNLINIEVEEVFCIYKLDKSRKIVVTSERGEYFLPSTVDQIGELMRPFGFLKIDKNRVINVYRIKRIEGNDVTVDGFTYTISRRKMKILKEMLSNYRPFA